jgi:O-antigen/teichoic acid export membrane protein
MNRRTSSSGPQSPIDGGRYLLSSHLEHSVETVQSLASAFPMASTAWYYCGQGGIILMRPPTSEIEDITSLTGESAPLKPMRLLVGKGALAVLDQGLFAGSNFLLNILLARWLSPSEYGAFAVAFSVFLLTGVFHTALLTEPMLVFGPGKHRHGFPYYLGALLRGHFALTIVGGGLLILSALALHRLYSPEIERSLVALGVAVPFILLPWLLRRAFYVTLSPGWAACGGGVYLASMIGFALLIHNRGSLSSAGAFLIMAGASTVASLIMCIPLGVRFEKNISNTAVAADHWQYGKWVAAAAVPSWIVDSTYFIILPICATLQEAGALKALLNLAMPALHTISALGVILLPVLVRDRERATVPAMIRTAKSFLAVFFVGCCCYGIILWELRLQVIQQLYAGNYTTHASWPLILVCLLPIAQSQQVVMGAALRAMQKPKLVFWSSVSGGVSAITVGIPLCVKLGLLGALIGLDASYIVIGISMTILLAQHEHDIG